MTTKSNPKTRAPGSPILFDKRVRDRNLESGLLDAKQLDKHLAELRDVAEQAEPVAVEQPGAATSDFSRAPQSAPAAVLEDEADS